MILELYPIDNTSIPIKNISPVLKSKNRAFYWPNFTISLKSLYCIQD